jgi:maleate isomerase
LKLFPAEPAGLPSDQQSIQPEQLYDWACCHVPASAEAVLICGNGFRAIGVIKALEHRLDRPVLTANQVAFWSALLQSGARAPVTNYGRIFEFNLPR